jgi:uncharacterized Zn finger protein
MARRRRSAYGWGGFRPYVPSAQRKGRAALEAIRARERGEIFDPVRVAGRSMSSTSWGHAWCKHIESFRDYENRLPRGRTYARNGSVLHLELRPGEIEAKVMGSELYELRIEIDPCAQAVWTRVRRRCAGGIGSLIELLEGRISSEVMAAMTSERDGLLPDLKQVRMSCSCPDWAALCKHLAAVLYGVGARLDERPELLFVLRGVDPAELVDRAALPGQTSGVPAGTRTIERDLSGVFGIELDEEPAAPSDAREDRSRTKKRAGRPKGVAERRSKVSRRELLQLGVPAGTIGTWLRSGILRASDERGVYLHSRESRARLADYRR